MLKPLESLLAPTPVSAPISYPALNTVTQLVNQYTSQPSFTPPTELWSQPSQPAFVSPSQLWSDPVPSPFRLDQLTNPSTLFKGSIPATGVLSSQASFATAKDQLFFLGQKYGVPYQQEGLDKYQSKVIKAIIQIKAREHGIPEAVALAISGNESNCKMWKDIERGIPVQGKNIRDGVLLSTDWGAMQINDKAHSKAFPRAKEDLEFNIDYGLRYLARQRTEIKGSLGLGFGDWDRTIASYNLGHNPSTHRGYEIAQRYVSHVRNQLD